MHGEWRQKTPLRRVGSNPRCRHCEPTVLRHNIDMTSFRNFVCLLISHLSCYMLSRDKRITQGITSLLCWTPCSNFPCYNSCFNSWPYRACLNLCFNTGRVCSAHECECLSANEQRTWFCSDRSCTSSSRALIVCNTDRAICAKSNHGQQRGALRLS